MKKFSALALALIMLWAMIMPACANPLEAFYTADISVDPGNPRAHKPVYSYAWLDNIVVRSDPSAVTSVAYTPTPEDYPYSTTFDDFITEVDNYSLLFKLDEETVGSAYEELINLIYYSVTLMGFTADYKTMCEYLRSYGISLSENVEDNATAVGIVYAALKYDAVYVLYEKQVEIPIGTSVDHALVMILAALTATTLPSGIDSYIGFGLLAMKNYVEGFDALPLSENPDAAEIFHWAKVITASENEYQVPVASFHEATRAQKEYVDYLYYASIINGIYEINVDPIRLIIAMQSTEERSLQKFILKSMLDSKQIGYEPEITCEELFALACQNGFFSLEDDFYTDVFAYEFTVPTSCPKVWFTPFSLASQLEGGDDAYLSLFLNGVQMSPNSTVSTDLDATKAEEIVELKSVYDDGVNPKQEVTYKFRVIKSADLEVSQKPVAENDMVGQVESFIGTIIPNSNSVANEKVDEIFSSIDSAISQVGTGVSDNLLTTYGTESTTFDLGATTSVAAPQTTTTQAVSDGERFDFGYLEQLIDGVYVTDENGNIVTTKSLSDYADEDEDEGNIIDKVTETVKENPEVVAVPSSLLAAFSVMGYFMTKKHRDGRVVGAEDDEEESENGEE